MRKFADIRPVSPIKSPLKTVTRPVSPFRHSPFSKQIPMSPLRTRKNNMQSSRTPTKAFPIKRAQTERQPVGNNGEKDMVKTIKNGMGLFQQLAFKNKLASEKKENQMAPFNSKPSEFEYRSRATTDKFHDKNSFGALIENVKQIESIQAGRAQEKSNSTIQLSFKAMEKSKTMENTVKTQFNKVPMLSSFGIDQQTIKSNISNNQGYESGNKNNHISTKMSKQTEANINKNKEVEQSYGDILLMIKKASQKNKSPEQKMMEESVKVSYEENDESLSMSPFF